MILRAFNEGLTGVAMCQVSTTSDDTCSIELYVKVVPK
jgi:hypothetical protein